MGGRSAPTTARSRSARTWLRHPAGWSPKRSDRAHPVRTTDRKGTRDNRFLACPPWINKFYIMDIGPGRSFVEWAIRHGATVSSSRTAQPGRVDERGGFRRLPHRRCRGGDGRRRGDHRGDEDRPGGLCLGGCDGVDRGGYLTAAGDPRLGTLTLANTLLDYSNPGGPATTDRPRDPREDRHRDAKGVPGRHGHGADLRLLRCERSDLRVLGEPLDAGRGAAVVRPARVERGLDPHGGVMHSTYLHSLYGENQLAQGRFTIAGRTISLRDATATSTSWRAGRSHRAVAVVVRGRSAVRRRRAIRPVERRTHRRHRQSGGQEDLGRGLRRTGDPATGGLPADPTVWRESAQRRSASWWEDWATWSQPARRRPAGAAADGQQAAPGDRNCTRHIRFQPERCVPPSA
ncbi:hypothetical protein GS438_11745 [Rhodococcus hoagii]|nr:hypothetical protein [Prescottella equi]